MSWTREPQSSFTGRERRRVRRRSTRLRPGVSFFSSNRWALKRVTCIFEVMYIREFKNSYSSFQCASDHLSSYRYWSCHLRAVQDSHHFNRFFFCRGYDLSVRVRRARLTSGADLIRMCHCHCHCHYFSTGVVFFAKGVVSFPKHFCRNVSSRFLFQWKKFFFKFFFIVFFLKKISSRKVMFFIFSNRFSQHKNIFFFKKGLFLPKRLFVVSKKKIAFARRWVCFSVHGNFPKRDRFSVFFEAMCFFFHWCFVFVFAKRRSFLSKMVFFFKK